MKKIYFLFGIFVLFASCSNSIPEFKKEEAFTFLEEQCDLGTRFPGSEEIELCRNYIISTLDQFGAVIEKQEFFVEIEAVQYAGVNIIASYFPEMNRRILLGAHYDTRPWADKEENQNLHNSAIIGANDGASGVAVLLEIAAVLSDNPSPRFGVDLVFFDLEDMGNYGDNGSWCLGSKYFAENFPLKIPEKAIIVDMIGDADLQIFMEYYSYHNSPKLVNEIWNIAKVRGFYEFKHKIGTAVVDDHLPLIRNGINAIDIIDFDYPYWHTLEDTPDKCSAKSLYIVGQTLLDLIYKTK
ncbi:MAG: M28 family peptidase [Candidatus Cloacimonetes bacterium]|nr:M28 family peptidase [Candidatus Cloacimonadota bacterium]